MVYYICIDCEKKLNHNEVYLYNGGLWEEPLHAYCKKCIEKRLERKY
jgi:hypothetical protein